MSAYEPTGVKKYFHQARRALAKSWLHINNPKQIAVTGSQGKTHVSYILYELFSKIGKTIRTDVNLDTIYNVPITALQVRPSTEYVIWELGIDKPNEMDLHLEIAKPETSIVTGISPVHTDKEHLGSLENLIREKRKIIEALPETGHAVLNYEDAHVRSMQKHTAAKIVWYGTDRSCNLRYQPESIEITVAGTSAMIFEKNSAFKIQTGLIGEYHIINLLAAYGAFRIYAKNEARVIFKAVAKSLKPLRGRMNIEPGPMETLLLNDSLRANPASTDAGVRTLDRMQYTEGRKIAVIGEMGELENPEEEHKKTAKTIRETSIDFVIGIGPLRKLTIDELHTHGFPKEKTLYASDVFEAAEILRTMLKKNDLWYLKGSLLRNYKRIVQLLNGEEVCCREILCPYEHCGY